MTEKSRFKTGEESKLHSLETEEESKLHSLQTEEDSLDGAEELETKGTWPGTKESRVKTKGSLPETKESSLGTEEGL